MRPAVVCVGYAGINGLATVRSLGRRGVPVHVVSLATSAQIASGSRYCRGFTAARELGSLHDTLLGLPAGAILYIDNDEMLKALAPRAAELARHFALVDEVGDAGRLTSKTYQLRIARQAGIAVPRSWQPQTWAELRSIETARRLIAKPLSGRGDFKTIVAADAAALATALRERSAVPAEVLVQEYVEGDDDAIYVGLCYVARSHGHSFVLSARKLRQSRPGAGVMALGQAADAPQVREMTRRVARAAGVRGVLSTEFKLDARDGRYYFIEWNPRPAYFQSIGWRAGFDLAWLAYCDHTDPARLAALPHSASGEHYWINVHAELMHFSRDPALALRLRTWKAYFQNKEWAVFALDDPAPWVKAMRLLGRWLLRDRSFSRALARLAARRA